MYICIYMAAVRRPRAGTFWRVGVQLDGIYIYIPVYIYIYIYVHICIYVCIYMYVYIWMALIGRAQELSGVLGVELDGMYISVSIYIYMYLSVSIHVCIYLFMFIYRYRYRYRYRWIYIHPLIGRAQELSGVLGVELDGMYISVSICIIFFFYLSCHTTLTPQSARAQSEKHCRRRGASSGQKTRGCIEGERPGRRRY